MKAITRPCWLMIALMIRFQPLIADTPTLRQPKAAIIAGH